MRQGRNNIIRCKECGAHGVFNHPFGNKSKERIIWRQEPYDKCKTCKRKQWIKSMVNKNGS